MPISRQRQQMMLRQALRYARKTSLGGGMFHRLGQRFGPFGELLGMIVDLISGGAQRPSRRNIDDAIRLLTEQGYRVIPEPPTPPAQPPVQGVQRPTRAQPPVISTRVRGPAIPTSPGPDIPREEAAEIWPEEHGLQVEPTRIRGAYDLVPEGVEGLSPEIETPESSNIYSLQYDYNEGILYVRFKAEGNIIGRKIMTSICSGKEYMCQIRDHEPGPLYSYGGRGHKITPDQFAAFVGATSKGQHLWQHYRVCGSTWAHQVPYTMVSTVSDYVPRKATRAGLRVRTVPTVGHGRRGGRLSTLPERLRS